MGNTESATIREYTPKPHTSTLDNRNTREKCDAAGSSRAFFLLYLIHRTWSIVIDTVDSKSKKCVNIHLTQYIGQNTKFDSTKRTIYSGLDRREIR